MIPMVQLSPTKWRINTLKFSHWLVGEKPGSVRHWSFRGYFWLLNLLYIWAQYILFPLEPNYPLADETLWFTEVTGLEVTQAVQLTHSQVLCPPLVFMLTALACTAGHLMASGKGSVCKAAALTDCPLMAPTRAGSMFYSLRYILLFILSYPEW